MLRDLEAMQDRLFDVLIVGGGIYGACAAWDAALRGLSVALVEKDDFGHAASSNSLRIMHGGLRYLRDVNVSRARIMALERRAWLRIAPRLVRPLPFVLPTGGFGVLNRAAIRAALAVNDLISFDRNDGLPADSYIPSGRIVSRQECLNLIPGLENEGIDGAAIWHDAQLQNSERLLMLILQAAVRGGASIANYAELIAMQAAGRDAMQAQIRDAVRGGTTSVRARLILNCAGAWSEDVLKLSNRRATLFRPSLAVNLVTRQILSDAALAVPSEFDGRRRFLFIVPWKDRSMIGTWHFQHTGAELRPSAPESAIKTFLEEINAGLPAAGLKLDDVCHVQAGFLPAYEAESPQSAPRLIRECQIRDHRKEDGLERVISVIGVKYTTARHAAQKAIDHVLRRLGRSHVPCRTHRTKLSCVKANDRSMEAAWPVARRITATGENFAPARREERNEGWETEGASTGFEVDRNGALSSRVFSAVRTEMAHTLTDLLRRRTDLGAAGPPEKSVVEASAQAMAAALGWSEERKAAEIKALHESYEANYLAADAEPR